MDINSLSEADKVRLVNQRWSSADPIWEIVKATTTANLKIYKNNPDYISSSIAIQRKSKVRANRVFRNMESVINALIANPPKPNFIPTQDTDGAKKLSATLQKYFAKKYDDINVKEQIRKGFRNLYFSRLIVLKPFWNSVTNDFDVRSIDPCNIRVSPQSTKEVETSFIIEEVSDNLMSVIARFPAKKTELLEKSGYSSATGEVEAFIANPVITYREAWIDNEVLFTYGAMLLGQIKNPTWDWDGLRVTEDEATMLSTAEGTDRRDLMTGIRGEQSMRAEPIEEEMGPESTGPALQAYLFNHFDFPRKPYIFATIFNNENTPIGQTDMITQAAPLQENVDRRKQDIDENASLVNGQVKVDSSVMTKADAQKLRFEARGVIWGKGVKEGVTRETGSALPAFVFEDMKDSRDEIDNIMAASSAFRGEREGTETKAGRLALIDQSYLALNELVQVMDYCCYEMFNWFYQIAKVNYTENHLAKLVGVDRSLEIVSLMQDDFMDGAEIKIVPGKTLPEDSQFKYEQAQADAEKGFISPIDYLEIAGYDNPAGKAKSAQMFILNPPVAAGLTPEEIQELAPPKQEEVPPATAISFKDLPPDGKIQLAAQARIQLDPLVMAAQMAQEQADKQAKETAKATPKAAPKSSA